MFDFSAVIDEGIGLGQEATAAKSEKGPSPAAKVQSSEGR